MNPTNGTFVETYPTSVPFVGSIERVGAGS
jgi:hypothetical protein